MSQITAFGRDIFVRRTDVNGKVSTDSVRVWDAERKLAAMHREDAAENAKQPEGAPQLARTEQITEQQYAQGRTPRK